MPEKKDMSNSCDFMYQDYWTKANVTHELTQEDWMRWYNEHCANCKYMGEICMYGEDYSKNRV